MFSFEIPPTHFQSDPQIVPKYSHTHKMTLGHSVKSSLNRLFIVNLFQISELNGLINVGFSIAFGGAGGFREVREVNYKNFHQFSPKATRGIPIYGQKIKKVNDYKKATNISM